MLKITIVFSILLHMTVFGHGGDDGLSSLEEEFSKLSHIHLPMNFNTLEGLVFGYPLPGEHEDHFIEEDHDHSVHESESGFEIDLHPVLFAGYDKINRFVNLTEAKEGRVVDRSSEMDKFLHIQSKKWSLGIGIEGDMHLPLPTWALAFGFSYIKAKNYISKMSLNSRLEKRKKLKIPSNLEAFESWRVGDSLQYMSSGTMVFAVMLGVEPFFHVGPEYIHSGNYQTRISKKESGKLEVELITSKTNSIGLEGNAIIAGVEASRGHGQLSSIKYILDVNNPKSFSVLNLLISGRADLANRQVELGNAKLILRSNMKTRYNSITGSIGLPVLFFRGRSVGNYQANGEIDHIEESDQENMYSSTYMKEKFSRGVISRHSWEMSSVSSTVVKEFNHTNDSIVASQFSYSFSNDNMKFKEFKRKFYSLIKKYNLKDIDHVRLPLRKNGFVEINLKLSLSGQVILRLLRGGELESLSSSRRTLKKLLGLRFKVERSYKNKNYKNMVKSLSRLMKVIFTSDRLTQKFLKNNEDVKIKLQVMGDKIRQHHYECGLTCTLE